jgi:hypothetical protein
MLQHILNQKNSCNHGSRPRLPRRGRHRLPNTTSTGAPPDTGGCFLLYALYLQLKDCILSTVEPGESSHAICGKATDGTRVRAHTGGMRGSKQGSVSLSPSGQREGGAARSALHVNTRALGTARQQTLRCGFTPARLQLRSAAPERLALTSHHALLDCGTFTAARCCQRDCPRQRRGGTPQ